MILWRLTLKIIVWLIFMFGSSNVTKMLVRVHRSSRWTDIFRFVIYEEKTAAYFEMDFHKKMSLSTNFVQNHHFPSCFSKLLTLFSEELENVCLFPFYSTSFPLLRSFNLNVCSSCFSEQSEISGCLPHLHNLESKEHKQWLADR